MIFIHQAFPQAPVAPPRALPKIDHNAESDEDADEDDVHEDKLKKAKEKKQKKSKNKYKVLPSNLFKLHHEGMGVLRSHILYTILYTQCTRVTCSASRSN